MVTRSRRCQNCASSICIPTKLRCWSAYIINKRVAFCWFLKKSNEYHICVIIATLCLFFKQSYSNQNFVYIVLLIIYFVLSIFYFKFLKKDFRYTLLSPRYWLKSTIYRLTRSFFLFIFQAHSKQHPNNIYIHIHQYDILSSFIYP